MKVAYIVERYPRLYHTFIRHEIAGLVERGAEVIVFSLYRDAAEGGHDPAGGATRVVYFEDALPRRLPRLIGAALAQERRVARASAGLHRWLGRALIGARTDSGEYRQDLGWIGAALGGVAAVIRAGRFDVIHAGFGNRSATAAMLLARATGVPFSFTTHAFDLYVDFRHAAEKIRECRCLFTVSNYNREYLVRQHRCPPEKLRVLRVPFDRARCDELQSAERAEALIVSVGRLHPIKGFACAVDAMERVVARRPGVRYVIVGAGPLRAELEASIRARGLERHVTLRGDLRNRDALALVARATIFLLPSVVAANGDRDGIPTSLLESMYLGTPVVSSRVSGIPELVEDGVDGLLAEPGDVPGIARCLERLLEDSRLRRALGEAAREKVRLGFYREHSADTLLRSWRAFIRDGTSASVVDGVATPLALSGGGTGSSSAG